MGPLIIDMHEFTCVGWVEGLYSCTVKCDLCTSKVCMYIKCMIRGHRSLDFKVCQISRKFLKNFQIFKKFIENLKQFSNIFLEVVSIVFNFLNF